MSRNAYENPQTELRIAMQKNGYCWVPNNGKRTRGRGWAEKAIERREKGTTASVRWWDTAMVEDEDTGELRHIENPSTGLLVEGDLIALDVDVDDEDMVKGLFNRAADILGDDWADKVLVRYREGAAKECWVFRVAPPKKQDDDAFPRPGKNIGPHRYFTPGTTVDDISRTETKGGWTRSAGNEKPQTIEFFRGGECQIGALGPHTPADENGEGEILYQWLDDRSPVNVPRSELPVVTHKQLMEFYRAWGQVLDNAGWVLDERPQPGSGGQHPKVYDLDPEVTFYTGSRDFPEEVDYEALDTGDTVRMLEIVGEGTNPERGWCLRKQNGVVGVFDFEHETWHWPSSEDPTLWSSRAERLGETLKSVNAPGEPEVDGQDDDQVEDQAEDEEFDPVMVELVKVLRRYHVEPSVEDEDTEAVIAAYQAATEDFSEKYGEQVEAKARLLAARYIHVHEYGASPQKQWRSLAPGLAGYKVGITGKAVKDFYNLDAWIVVDRYEDGSEKKVIPIAVGERFLESRLPVRIEGVAYRPTSALTVVKNDYGHLEQNLYRPPRLGEAREELVELYRDLIAHIFDRDDERLLWEEVTSYKFLHREQRGVTQLYVADGVEGVGRNTLVEGMLFGALGPDNCERVSPGMIDTSKGQEQYNDWQFNSLLWFIPELKHVDRKSWDALKDKLETSSGKVRGKEKYGRDLDDHIYGSMHMATNNLSGIAFDLRTSNRRFNAYANGAKGALDKNEDLYRRINEVRTGKGMEFHPDMLASVLHYHTVVWPEENHEPRQEVFMVGTPTVTKTRMVEASKKPSMEYLEATLEKVDAEGRIYVTPGEIEGAARQSAKLDDVPREVLTNLHGELNTQTSGGAGINGWVKVYGASGGAKVNVLGKGTVNVLAKGQEAADRFVEMSLKERAEALTFAPEGSNVTALGKGLQEHADRISKRGSDG